MTHQATNTINVAEMRQKMFPSSGPSITVDVDAWHRLLSTPVPSVIAPPPGEGRVLQVASLPTFAENLARVQHWASQLRYS